MGWSQDRQLDRTGRPVAVDPAKRAPQFRRAPPSAEIGVVAAIDLVYQAADVFQSIEDHAAETVARAHDLARQAAEQLNFAESRNRALEAAQRAAEADLKEANARADQAEQTAKETEAQIAAIQDRLTAAEQRASNAEARAIEAEKTLLRVEDAIRNQLLAKWQPLVGRSAAAA